MGILDRKWCISQCLLSCVLFIVFDSTLALYPVTRHKRQAYLPDSSVVPGGDGRRPDLWGEWGPPSACSRTCGGGVAYQTRQCTHIAPDGRSYCEGGDKKYFSCNTQECPEGTKDFRAEQCSKFDGVPFEGVTYEWVPYTKAPNPCELNCMPRGDRFYFRHKLKVIDGTRCNDETPDVCVNGICQPVGCDLMLGSSAREDKCRVCGGDGSTCDTLEGVLDEQDRPMGYNDLLLIPAGATNIEVKELGPSNNYLAVRNSTAHYYLNGNWRIQFPRVLSFAGCHWHYERWPQGFAAPDSIRCLGPITEPLYIVLLTQDRNVGVHYEYSAPGKLVRPSQPEVYTWTYDDFSPCSASCGGGLQTRRVTCSNRRDLQTVSDELCDASQRPQEQQVCSTEPCPARWVPGEWSQCSTPCGQAGVRQRYIFCQRIVANGITSLVDDNQCVSTGEPKPPQSEACNQGEICPEWHVGPWSPCDRLCGPGAKRREVKCFRRDAQGRVIVLSDSDCPTPRPESAEHCTIRPCEGVDWITSAWSGCSACGSAQETRVAHCASATGQIYPDEMCSGHNKPEVTRSCADEPCDGMWFSTQWTECSARCGKGVRTRKVFCGEFKEDVIKKIDESRCQPESKMEEEEECVANLPTCGAEWFTGPWKDCSVPCGGGVRTRKVLCMENEQVVPSTNCDLDLIEFATEECNNQSCTADTTLQVGSSQPMPEYTSESGVSVIISVTPPPEEEDTDEDDLEWCDEDEDYDEEESDADKDELGLLGQDVLKSSTTEDEDVSKSTMVTSESTMFSEDLMLSDSTGTDEDTSDTTDISLSTDELGSGDTTLEGSGDTSDTSVTMMSSTEEITESSSDKNSDTSDLSTSESSSTDSSVSSTDMSSSASSSESVTESTVESTKSSDSSASSQSGDTDSTDLSTDSSSTESSEVTSESSSSALTSELSSVSSSELSSESHTESSSGSDSTDSSDSTTESSSESTSDETSHSASTDEQTTASDDMTSNSDTTYSSEMSTESSDVTTESSDSTTDSSISTTESSDMTTDSSDLTSQSSDATTESSESTSEASSQFSSTESSQETSESSDQTSLSSGSTTESGATSSDELTSYDPGSRPPEVDGEVDTAEFSQSTISESSDMTTDSSVSTVEATSVESTSASDVSTEETESSVSTIDSSSLSTVESSSSSDDTSEMSTTEGSISESSSVSTVESSSSSDITSEVSSTEESTSESDVTSTYESTISSEVSESSTLETSTSESLETASTSDVSEDTSETDIWSSTDETSGSWETTPNTLLEAITKESKKKKKCKPRPKKKPKCATSEFGCCPDKKTAASGPFDEGCAIPETCKDTEFGCCPDGVSPAKGKNLKGCPKTLCKESLYGCCPDKKTLAQGNDQEGCPIPTTVAPGCKESEFGCCKDDVSFATGPNMEGCVCDDCTTEAPKDDCHNSEHGCCDDQVSFATGPEKEGCLLECQKTLFGCCRDRKTPAHGPNEEGCCLGSPYGCCPDDIQPARGPNYEGCDCVYSRYGCCPDNTTSARGAQQEGCDCRYTTHGCCPDGLTPAQGPEYHGCPCSSYQFGCCPDGVTISKGPYKQGCGCSESEFGCCPDGVSAASGLNHQGCDCSKSEHGCCLDGTTESGGDKFEGCTDKLEVPQEHCALDKERGTCRNYTVRWFFDSAYGGCSRFWYGGCDGNSNRFSSQEECKQICVNPEGKDRCHLPKITGPCDGYYPTWYYDHERKQCGQFIYGGCLGNNNRFETREECEGLCVSEETLDTCDQPVEEGPCRGSYERWYYDKSSHTCQRFRYGGCKGNKNNFLSEAACNQQCTVRDTVKANCLLPREQGTCDGQESRWFYDTKQMRCMPFYYSGCGANENNFASREDCERDCPSTKERDVCTLPSLVGECHNYTQHWYYDTLAKSCRGFYYGGCGGNGNNFADESSCLRRCSDQKPEEPQPPIYEPHDPIYDPQPSVHEPQQPVYEPHREREREREREEPRGPPAFARESCFMHWDIGDCDRTDIIRWYYDFLDGTCKRQRYSGCGGNGNNFATLEECEGSCSNVQDLCSLPAVPGSCDEFTIQWYYDASRDACLEFQYGGCGGNHNRFNSQRECLHRCYRGPDPNAIHYATVAPLSPDEPPSGDPCQYPVNPGPCNFHIPSWYYDNATQRCESFVYGGCEGNPNRFESQEICERHCDRRPEPVANETSRSDCSNEIRACEELRCPYGIQKSVNSNDCEYCSCYDPCSGIRCHEGSSCGIDLHRNPETGKPVFTGECRLDNKPGDCPVHFNHTQPDDRCTRECHTDAQCRGKAKCCRNGCSNVCVQPLEPQNHTEALTTIAPHTLDVEPPRLFVPYTRVDAEKGSVAELKCDIISGKPTPTLTWTKGNRRIDGKKDNFRLLPDNTLQIISVSERDAGHYTCSADNGIGSPVTEHIELQILEPTPHASGIVGDDNATALATLGSPLTLRCLYYGWPTPHVSWWRGKTVLPTSGTVYEQNRDGSIRIARVSIQQLGIYTCQTYNSIGKPSSWSIAVVTLGPVREPVGDEYRRFIIDDNNAYANQTEPHYNDTSSRTEPEHREPLTVRVFGPEENVNYQDEFEIRCDVTGSPTPTIHWYKDDQLIQNQNVSYVLSDNYSLRVLNATSEDSGDYRCVAQNQYSTAEDHINIRVAGIYVHPQCLDSPAFARCPLILRAGYCTHKYYSKFCCRSCTLAGQLPPNAVYARTL